MITTDGEESATMNIPGLTTESIQSMHELIRHAKAIDEALPADRKRYGVQVYPDWKQQADAFEAELRKRNEQFVPIDWS